ENIRRGVLITVPMFLLIGIIPSQAVAFTKAQCTGCGCSFERECHVIDGVTGCVNTCACKNGPQDDCMTKKLSGALGLQISKSPSKTIFRVPQSSPPARK